MQNYTIAKRVFGNLNAQDIYNYIIAFPKAKYFNKFKKCKCINNSNKE
jgi:hypothetical protein